MALVAPPPVDELPPAPARSEPPVVFSAKATAFAGALRKFGQQLAALGANVFGNAQEALGAAQQVALHFAQVITARNQAEQFALTAVNAPGTNATSVSTMTLSVGVKNPTIQAGKAIRQGQYGTFSVAGDGAKAMDGRVLTYDPATGAMTFDARRVEGAGTASNWVFALSAPQSMPPATPEDVWAGTAADKAVPPATLTEVRKFRALTTAATLLWDVLTHGYKVKVALGSGSHTLSLPSGLREGDILTLTAIQPPSGSPGTVVWPGAFKFGQAGIPVLPTANNAWTVVRGEVLSMSPLVIDAKYTNLGVP